MNRQPILERSNNGAAFGRSPPMAGFEESCGFYFIFGLFTFFVWMDMSFFGELSENGVVYNSSVAEGLMFPVKSVKLRMQDHTTHYINLPLMNFVDEKLGISYLPGISPNLISFTHLVVAIIAGKCFSAESLCVRRLGVVLFELRYQLDVLDGVVYRSQSHLKNTFVSGWGSYGYVIDAFTDTCGGIILAIGCTVYLNRYLPLKKKRGKLQDDNVGKKMFYFYSEEEEEVKYSQVSRRTVNFYMLLVTIQVWLRSFFWDFYLRSYHELLEVPRTGVPKELQMEVLKYRSTSAVCWLWKVSSADALLQITLLAILFDKLWQWVRLLNWAGPPMLAVVVIVSQLHLMQVRAFLGL